MSDKETNIKEKLIQALTSTIRVISDDLQILKKSEKDENSNKFHNFDLLSAWLKFRLF